MAGLSDAILEKRLKALESAVAALQNAGSSQRAGGKPPKPTGLVFSRQPGVISFEWDASPIADLKHYRIQLSESAGFTNATEYTTVDPRFTYYAGVSGVTYYARVAARNRSERSSDWSATASTTIGTAVATDESDEDDTYTTEIDYVSTSYETSSNYLTSGSWKPARLNASETLSLTVEIPPVGTWAVLVFAEFTAKGDNAAKDSISVQIAENGTRIGAPGASTHTDLATGRPHGATAFYFKKPAQVTNGATYQYSIEALAQDQSINQKAAVLGYIRLRIS